MLRCTRQKLRGTLLVSKEICATQKARSEPGAAQQRIVGNGYLYMRPGWKIGPSTSQTVSSHPHGVVAVSTTASSWELMDAVTFGR
jgi:hypothetical protein